MKRLALLLLCLSTAHAQTAITALTSFWEGNVSATDKILWDYKGSAHGMYVGLGPDFPATIFGGGFARPVGNQGAPGVGNTNSGAMAVPGALVSVGTGSWCYAVWVRLSTTSADPLINQWSANAALNSWLVDFSNGNLHATLKYAMTDGSSSSVADVSTDVNPGDLALVWVAYNSANGHVRIATNADTWTDATPAQPFQVPQSQCLEIRQLTDPFPCPLNIGHINAQYFPTGSVVFGRMMFWNGYIPTDAEKIAIYNSGSGRDVSYFGLTLSHPSRPLTVSLVNATFADDTLLAEQGLYWLRPYPLKFWNATLAAARGNYVWMRSTDHAYTGEPSSFTDGNCYIGYSSSPEILPTSWAQMTLHILEPLHAWDDTETPWLVYDPVAQLFFVYGNAERTDITGPVRQATHVFSSPDLVTWAWRGWFPNDCCSGHTYNHTGYAQVVRNATGNWTAQSILDSSESGTDGKVRLGLWSSTDGYSDWTIVRETLLMDTFFPYRNWQNQFVVADTSGPDPPFSPEFNRNYVSSPATQFELHYPLWPLFFHNGDAACTARCGGVEGAYNQLQDVRTYQEGDTVWLYAKWSLREPSSVRLYRGRMRTDTSVSFDGSVTILGGMK